MIRLTAIAIVVLLTTGCIGIQDPQVQVVNVRLDEVSPGGARVLVDLIVINPNSEELPMPQVDYRVDVVGGGSFEFTDRPYAALPRNGQTTLTLAAGISGVALQGKAVTVDGVVVFEPQGELRRVIYDNYVPLPSTRFSAQTVLE